MVFKRVKPVPVQPAPIQKVVQPVEEIAEETVSEEVESKNWSLEEVPVQTRQMFYSKKEDKFYTTEEAIVELLNRTED